MENKSPMASIPPSKLNSNNQTDTSPATAPSLAPPTLVPPPAAVASAPLRANPGPVNVAETRLRIAQRVALPTDVPNLERDDSLCVGVGVDVDAPVTFAAVAVITPDEAASLSLTTAQRTAIMKLTSGHTRVDAATAAGVTRLTLYRWLKHDPAFQCAYNAWQKDLITTAQGQLLAATRDAMGTVINAIRKGDARLAWKLLESQGLTTAPKAGPTDIHELERRELLDKRKRELDERKERSAVSMDDMFTLDGI